jgi:hypothetical protein
MKSRNAHFPHVLARLQTRKDCPDPLNQIRPNPFCERQAITYNPLFGSTRAICTDIAKGKLWFRQLVDTNPGG